MSLIPKLGLLALLVIFLQGHDGHARPANYTSSEAANGGGFVKAGGIHFMLAGKPLFLNGFNSYWMMFMASDPPTRGKVSSAFQQAAGNGMNVARTWAFSDGGNRALQKSPGSYDENVFKGLDFVVSEAKSRGVYLILSLVNNWDDFGGRKQYVQWARDRGEHLNSDDEFYINPVVKGFYKNHVKTVLTRINTITGVAYRDEPSILAWELMNEPRCTSDPSGKWIQDWVSEMAAHVKSIDSNHMLEVGLEGFYGQSNPGKPSQINPGGMLIGSDFISNNQVPQVDFATIHVYPEQWLKNASEKVQAEFVDKWVSTHIEDSKSILQKPMMVAEFGWSSKVQGNTVEKRDSYYKKMYDSIYSSASNGGSCAGGIFWQLMDEGMSSMGDGYEVVLQDSPSTATIIAAQSHKMSAL